MKNRKQAGFIPLAFVAILASVVGLVSAVAHRNVSLNEPGFTFKEVPRDGVGYSR